MKKILILFIAFTSFGLFAQTTSNDYFDRAYSKSDVKDYYGAIADYTKAIELDPNNANAYYNRGLSKLNLKNYYGAIADNTKAIELDPNNADAYFNRAIS